MKDDRTLFDVEDDEYEEMTDEEKYEISRNTDDMMLEIMFPDGQDDEQFWVMKSWKKVLMLIVIVGGIGCMVLSLIDLGTEYNKYIVGLLSGLTVIVPAVIWYSDSKENETRDDRINLQDEILGKAVDDLNKKADAEQGIY